MALIELIGNALPHHLHRCLSLGSRPALVPGSINPLDLTVALQEIRATTQLQALRNIAELALGIYDDAQTSDREHGTLHLPLAIECCRIVHCVLSIPSIRELHNASSLPPSLAESVEHLLRVLRDIRDQHHNPQIVQRIAYNTVEQYQRDLNHSLDQMLNGQLHPTSGPRDIAPDGVGDPAQDPALARFLTYIFSVAPTPSLIVDVASKIHMGLLLFIPLLYSSRIQGILSGVNYEAELEAQFVTTRSVPDPETLRPRITLRWWDAFSRGLVKEWMALRVLSGLILAAIFSMFQIPDFQGNEPMMVAAHLSFAAVVYSSVLMIYVNGWRGNSGASMWIQEIHEPFTIGFLWNTWILLALPAIWTTWGAIFFLTAMMMTWISNQGGNSDDSTPATLGGPTGSPRFTACRLWIIPLFTIAMVYLMLVIYTLRGLGRRRETRDSTVV
ncbi:hypothetical protein BD779DRAFT_1514605 [Infundibulicybe gibba]|nr:hypothetical protein BD779DRAFT_1514605 [Infundibulicybe gibba]